MSHTQNSSFLERRWWVFLIGIVVVAAAFRYIGYDYSLPYIDHPDEPNHSLAGRMVIDFGSAKPIQHGYPPGIITLNYVLLRWFHDPAQPPSVITPVVRLISITVSLFTVTLVGLMGRRLLNPLAGLFAAAIWAILPASIEFSRFATADPYLTFFTILAIYLVIEGVYQDNDRLITGSTLALMLAIVFKYTAVFIGPLLYLLPLYRLRTTSPERRRPIITNFVMNTIYWTVFFGWLIIIFPALEVNQIPNWAAPAESVGVPGWETIRWNWHEALTPLWTPLFPVAALIGYLGLYLKRQRVYGFGIVVLLACLALWFAGLSIFSRQAFRQYIAWGAMLSVWAGIGFAGLVTVYDLILSRFALKRGYILIAVLTVVLISIPMVNQSIDETYNRTLPDQRNDLAAYMDTSVPAGTYISERANHKTLNRDWGGYAGETSFDFYGEHRLADQSPDAWREAGVDYAIVPYERYQDLPDELLDELLLLKSFPPKAHYRGPSMVVFRTTPIPYPEDQQLANITLAGYDLNRDTLSPGESLTFRHYWRAQSTPTANYRVFNHLLDVDRNIIAQADGTPLPGDRRPSTTWDDPDEIIMSQSFEIIIPAENRVGDYQLISGFYDPATGQRLADDRGKEYFTISKITVEADPDSDS